MKLKCFSPIDQKIFERIKRPNSLERDPTCSIYTNRNLDFAQIKAVGFDMDYTLANYHKGPMESLQYQMTALHLVRQMGYPKTLLKLSYEPRRTIRGLVVDKRYGHLLKMDMHGHVWRAMHGREPLEVTEIDALYKNLKIKITKDFASLDTLFAMPESTLYCDLVEMFRGKEVDYGQIFEDIRTAIDTIHSDGSLKSIISANLQLYVESHPDIALTLHKLRSANKKLFLLTNSQLDYTKTIMSYLLGDSWQAFFDTVITDSQKPAFFTEHRPFVELEPTVYSGGNIHEFESMMELMGEEILYVGDHIYGDIVRSKKETLWRTCLIVDELPAEIEISRQYHPELDNISRIDLERLELDHEIGLHRVLLAYMDAAGMLVESSQIRHEMADAKRYLAKLDNEIDQLRDVLERRYHPFWGELFYEHHDLSRFGSQVRSYACIYTGKITNFLHYSPLHTFRKTGELMNHDVQFRRIVP